MLTNESLLKTHIPTLLALWRRNKNSNSLSPKELSSVSDNLVSLQRGLTGDRRLAGSGYMENPQQLGAYLLYYWPISYQQIYYAIKNCSNIENIFKKDSIKILDVGCGPAPASVTICDFLAQNSSAKLSVTLMDYSSSALDLASHIYKSDLKSVPITTRVHNIEKDPLELHDSFDIIVMSHALNELWKDNPNFIEKRTDFLLDLSKKLEKNGLLLLSEPALLNTSRNLIALRDRLLENGFSVLSPCLGHNKCPALQAGPNHTCHADIQWKPIEPIASIAKKAKLDRESVKMTYFILQKDTDSVPLNTNTVPYSGKIVSDGMLNKSGRIRFLLCDGEKRIALSAKKEDSHAQKLGFFDLRRYDSISLINPEIRGDKENLAYGIKEDTDLRVQKYS